jgi:predicted transcriptional regulator
MINNYLKSLGLNDSQATVYVSLVEHGESDVKTITQNTELSRTALYPILSKLMKLGIISQASDKGVAHFVANNPEALRGLILKEKAAITKKEVAVDKLIDIFSAHFQPKIQFYYGHKNIQLMLDKYLNIWFDDMSRHDNTLWGYQDPSFVRLYHKWLKKYWKTMGEDHKIRLFSATSQVEQKLKNTVGNRTVKFLPNHITINSTIWINGDYVTMITLSKASGYSLQIKDKTFSSNLRDIFKLLWSVF